MSPTAPKPQKAAAQIWWFNQAQSRANTDPSQPTDPSKPNRMMLVLTGSHLSQVTCVPIQSLPTGTSPKMTEVELLQTSYGWLKNDSMAICHSIVTVPEKFFLNYVGNVNGTDMDKVKTAIKTHLRLK